MVQISFNEQLKSGQEYNFFSRLLFITNRGKYLKKDVSKRRIHSGSIQVKLSSSKQKTIQLLENELHLWRDIHTMANWEINKRILKRIIRFSYETTEPFSIPYFLFQIEKLLLFSKIKSFFILYNCWVITNILTGKGYFFIKKNYKILN